jgi:uncharacterized protein
MKFICDKTLGKLTKYLRILGFDTVSLKNLETLEICRSAADSSLFFTKQTKAIQYKPLIIIKADKIQEQISEIADIIRPYFDSKAFMTRCIECNTLLRLTEKQNIEERVPEYIYHHHERFKLCPSCRKVYWEGTHVEQMKKWSRVLNL